MHSIEASVKRAAKTCNLLQNAEWKGDLLPPSFIPVNNFGDSLQGRFDEDGKTRNSCMFFLCPFYRTLYNAKGC